MPLQGQALHGIQQLETSAFEAAGVAEAACTSAAGSSQQLPSMSSTPGQGMAATLSGPSGSSHSTDLMYMQSSISSALSGHSVAASLQEAMQQMRLQAGLGPRSTQQRAAPAAAATEHVIVSTVSQSSGELGQQLQQAQGEQQSPAQQPQQEQEEEHATLFFAKVPRSAARQQIEALFAAFGQVVSLNLFAPYEGSPSSKGCGLVVMRSYADAAAAIAGLDNYKWEGMHSAMVVKVMPPQRQRQEQSQGQGQGQAASSSGPSSANRSPAQGSSSRLASATSPGARSVYGSGGQPRVVLGVDVPPPGCAPDAYKLFVGNIPRAYAEPDLLPIFESIGPVRELIVLRDRATQESKGSAFVWYATGADADKAQLHFNMQLVLQQRSGGSSRPLVVRRAAPSKHSQVVSGMAAGPMGVSGYPQAQMQQVYAVAVQQGATLGSGEHGYAPVAASAPPQAAEGGVVQLGLPYAPTSLPATAGMAGAQLYYDTRAGPVTVVPYLQPQQLLWQQQQQHHMQSGGATAVPHCQAQQAAPYAAPMMLPVSEGYSQVMQQGTWQPGQQMQQQQPAYVAAAPRYDLSQIQGAAGLPVSAPIPFAAVEYAQQTQPGMGSVVSSLPQAVPAASHLVQQGQHALGGSSLSPASNVLLGGSACSSSSSNVASYQQLGGQHHSLIIPLSADQLNLINTQVGSVAAMSGSSITAEHNYACGSLALNVIAGSRQQLNTAWQMIQSLLGQAGGPIPQVVEGLM